MSEPQFIRKDGEQRLNPETTEPESETWWAGSAKPTWDGGHDGAWLAGISGLAEPEGGTEMVDETEARVAGVLASLKEAEVRVVNEVTGGAKGSKMQRYDLLPPGPLSQLAYLYGKGAEKYQIRNWERGYEWSLTFAAMQRHLWQFWGGEDIDEETGVPHVICAAWHCFALAEFMRTHQELDNRPK